MKRKLAAILLILTLSVLSLSSCLMFDIGSMESGSGGDKDKTEINVQGGDNYDISINSTAPATLLAANKALLSSVSIFTTTSAGSGVIYKLDKTKGDAYIITNFHVVYNENTRSISPQIKAYLYGMEAQEYEINTQYVGGSKNYDIAILKVTGSRVLMESIAAQAETANSNDVAILDTAIAIGNAKGDGISATVGFINVDSENITVTTDGFTAVSLRVMRTDAAVNSGNSGGGLYNEKGELIGIVNAKNADSETDNIGFAIPSNVAVAVAENVIYHCDGTTKTSVYKYMLGITVSPASLSAKYDTESGKVHKVETVQVLSLTATSAVSGLIEVGDIINSITIDETKHEVTRTFHVVDSMLYVREGSVVVMNVTRGGTAIDVVIPIKAEMLTES